MIPLNSIASLFQALVAPTRGTAGDAAPNPHGGAFRQVLGDTDADAPVARETSLPAAPEQGAAQATLAQVIERWVAPRAEPVAGAGNGTQPNGSEPSGAGELPEDGRSRPFIPETVEQPGPVPARSRDLARDAGQEPQPGREGKTTLPGSGTSAPDTAPNSRERSIYLPERQVAPPDVLRGASGADRELSGTGPGRQVSAEANAGADAAGHRSVVAKPAATAARGAALGDEPPAEARQADRSTPLSRQTTPDASKGDATSPESRDLVSKPLPAVVPSRESQPAGRVAPDERVLQVKADPDISGSSAPRGRETIAGSAPTDGRVAARDGRTAPAQITEDNIGRVAPRGTAGVAAEPAAGSAGREAHEGRAAGGIEPGADNAGREARAGRAAGIEPEADNAGREAQAGRAAGGIEPGADNAGREARAGRAARGIEPETDNAVGREARAGRAAADIAQATEGAGRFASTGRQTVPLAAPRKVDGIPGAPKTDAIEAAPAGRDGRQAPEVLADEGGVEAGRQAARTGRQAAPIDDAVAAAPRPGREAAALTDLGHRESQRTDRARKTDGLRSERKTDGDGGRQVELPRPVIDWETSRAIRRLQATLDLPEPRQATGHRQAIDDRPHREAPPAVDRVDDADGETPGTRQSSSSSTTSTTPSRAEASATRASEPASRGSAATGRGNPAASSISTSPEAREAEAQNATREIPRVDYRALVDSIVSRARALPQNGSIEVKFALSPEELGQVLVRIESHGDQVKIRILAASRAAMEALSAGASRLAVQMTDAGFGEPDIDLGFQSPDGESFARQQQAADREQADHDRNGRGSRPGGEAVVGGPPGNIASASRSTSRLDRVA